MRPKRAFDPAARGHEAGADLLRCTRRVLSYEVDGFGHLNNAVYLQYLEGARMNYMWQRGLFYRDFFLWKRFPVVARASIEFKTPARADDELEITAWIASHSTTRFALSYEVRRAADRALIAVAETVHVFVDERGRPQRIPPPFYQKFIAGQASG